MRIAHMAFLIAALVLVLSGCGTDQYIHYRITLEIEVDGEVRSGSSIIQAQFYGGGRSSPKKYGVRLRGVSPVVDLGPYGWLAIPIRHHHNYAYWRAKTFNLTYERPKDLDEALDVFQKDVADLVALRSGRSELPSRLLPAFAWFPAGQPYTEADQLFSEEFPRVIGRGVHLRAVTIELTPGAILEKKLSIEPEWLVELRKLRGRSISRLNNKYTPSPTDFETLGYSR